MSNLRVKLIVLCLVCAIVGLWCGDEDGSDTDAERDLGSDRDTAEDRELAQEVDAVPEPDATTDPDLLPEVGDDTAVDSASEPDGGGNGETEFTQEKIGDPKWEIIDWQHYTGDLGTIGSGFVEQWSVVLAVWPLHKRYVSLNVLGPDEVHAPPYIGELPDGVVSAGYDSGNRWPRSAWQAPAGLTLSACIVPAADAPTGRSTDFESGPIIPETIFPITVDGDLLKGNVIIDAGFDSSYPAIDTVVPSANADGYSHMPLNFGENTEFIAGGPGEYEYRVRVTDVNGDGWSVSIPFTIE